MEEFAAKFDLMIIAQQCCYLQECLSAGWRCNTNWNTLSTDGTACSNTQPGVTLPMLLVARRLMLVRWRLIF